MDSLFVYPHLKKINNYNLINKIIHSTIAKK